MDISSPVLDWTRFERADQERLRRLWASRAARMGSVAELLTGFVRQIPGSEALFEQALLHRPGDEAGRWLESALNGPWDQAWLQGHERNGRAWSRLGLPLEGLSAVAHGLQDELVGLVDGMPEPAETCRAIGRLIGRVLGAMTAGAAREEATAPIHEVFFTHLPAAALLIDEGGVVSAATRSVGALHGDGSPTGRRWSEVLPPPLVEAAGLEAHVEEVLVTGRGRMLGRVDVGLLGRERAFRIDLVPVDHGQARLLLQVDELTEALEAERHQARMESRAQLCALSAAVAHELRNPLLGVSGAIHAIARTIPTEDPRKPVMAQVEAEVLRLDDLVKDLLAFADPFVPQLAPVELGALAALAVADARIRYPLATIRLEGAGGALADPALVRRVVEHLLENACLAVDSGGEVWVQVGPGQVLVCDAGAGIPSAYAEKIFAPFFTTRTRGTGLGLTICRKAAEAMGGSIRLVSGPLPGAALLLSLPALDAA